MFKNTYSKLQVDINKIRKVIGRRREAGAAGMKFGALGPARRYKPRPMQARFASCVTKFYDSYFLYFWVFPKSLTLQLPRKASSV